MSELFAEDGTLTLSPVERLQLLCDPGSLRLLRTQIRATWLGERAREGDGVVVGSGTVDGRPVLCYAQDPAFLGGSLGQAQADSIVRVMRLARRARAPIVAFVASGGARLQEGGPALAAYGRIFRWNVSLSGQVPQISVVTGTSAGGATYSPALTDFVVMTREARMFLTGPRIVEEVIGEAVEADELGGPKVHGGNGVCHLVAPDELRAIDLARRLLGYLTHGGNQADPTALDPHGNPGAIVPDSFRRAYDMRDLIAKLVDRASALEIAPDWGASIVTSLATIGGRAVGIVASQPQQLAGVIDADAAQKAARVVRTCNAFGLPLLALVDTPGFLPGSRQEHGGIIRHGAKLLFAFAEATVPKITVVVRKAYGGAYITMNSKALGADLTFAWPNAEIGVMGPQEAVRVINRRELEQAEDSERTAEQLAERYAEEHLSAQSAAANGLIDEVIEPAETRERLVAALETLYRGPAARAASGNVPL